VAAVAAIAAAAVPVSAAAQPLPVPYLSQTEDLCGGAAAAMVMRYWGASETYPDAFQPLVDRAAGGIRTGALTADLERRGWRAIAGSGDGAQIATELARGRPVIALVQDSPGRYHYVVVVGWQAGKVTLHDPARAPSRVIGAAGFDAAWRKSGRWMLVVLPPAARPAEVSRVEPPSASSVAEHAPAAGACARLVDDGIALAAGDRVAARALLMRATSECAADGAAWRELAGLDALDADWTAAASHAQRAVALDPGDRHAWRILATSSYLRHDDVGALAAWNHLGEPEVRLIDVRGLERTRYDVIADAIGVPLRSILTPAAVTLAERRVRDIPSIAAARVGFHPAENGSVQIDASIFERDRAPWRYPAWVRIGFDALADRQVSGEFSSPTGGGEVVGATWRWWEHRPMIAGFVAAPAPREVGGGSWRLDVMHETQTFGSAAMVETRTGVAMTLGNWITERTRFRASAALEHWNDRTSDVMLSYGVEHWRAEDRLRLSAKVGYALGTDAFATASVSAAARSKSALEGFVLASVTGYSVATTASPLSVWPGADTGHARDILLRAHPLLQDGIVTSGAFGRRLAFATVEAQRWRSLRRVPAVRIAPAAFVDGARATHQADPSGSRLHVDAGAGLRVAVPGAGVMRIDVAHGLRDGGTVLSAGWDVRWR
jgi:hypothetical protein